MQMGNKIESGIYRHYYQKFLDIILKVCSDKWILGEISFEVNPSQVNLRTPLSRNVNSKSIRIFPNSFHVFR